jgi:hypothetical protein
MNWRLCWNQGLPGDFDVAQINWRPDYDSYYHEQLNKRARTMYVFRNEYIFDLEKSVVVEVPQAGHATYVFSKPPDVKHWVWQYAKTTRQEFATTAITLLNRSVSKAASFTARTNPNGFGNSDCVPASRPISRCKQQSSLESQLGPVKTDRRSNGGLEQGLASAAGSTSICDGSINGAEAAPYPDRSVRPIGR